MTRDAFLAALRQGLAGLPPEAIADIMSDYEAHFADAAADGRPEAEVSAALGDPARLARELKAEAGLKRWEEKRDPSAAAGAVFAVLGLGAVDLLILLPVLAVVGGVLFGMSVATVAVFVAGGWVFGAGLMGGLPFGPASPAQAAFAGLGMMCGAVGAGALIVLILTWIVNLLVRYARLHFRLLKPTAAA